MVPSVAAKIWLTWETALKAALTGLPIAWPNQMFDPAKVTDYWDVAIQSAPTERLEVNGRKALHKGMVICRHTSPHSSKAVLGVIEKAGQLAEAFYQDRVLGYLDLRIRVTKAPEVLRGYRDGGYWHQPVRIQWETYA